MSGILNAARLEMDVTPAPDLAERLDRYEEAMRARIRFEIAKAAYEEEGGVAKHADATLASLKATEARVKANLLAALKHAA
jgi:hypothetical protein